MEPEGTHGQGEILRRLIRVAVLVLSRPVVFLVLWDAVGRGSSHCISWYQIQLILTMCFFRYRTALWDTGSIGHL